MSNDNKEEFVTTVTTTNLIGDPLSQYGLPMNSASALTIPAFYSGLRFLSEAFAALPKHVYKKTGEKRDKQDHPLSWIVNDEINDLVIPFTFWETLESHAVGWGNGYARIEYSGSRPKALYNLMPDRVQPFRAPDSSGTLRTWYAVEIEVDGRSKWVPVEAREILHLPGLGFDGLKGYSVVELMSDTLSAIKAADKYANKFFSSGGHLGGFD